MLSWRFLCHRAISARLIRHVWLGGGVVLITALVAMTSPRVKSQLWRGLSSPRREISGSLLQNRSVVIHESANFKLNAIMNSELCLEPLVSWGGCTVGLYGKWNMFLVILFPSTPLTACLWLTTLIPVGFVHRVIFIIIHLFKNILYMFYILLTVRLGNCYYIS